MLNYCRHDFPSLDATCRASQTKFSASQRLPVWLEIDRTKAHHSQEVIHMCPVESLDEDGYWNRAFGKLQLAALPQVAKTSYCLFRIMKEIFLQHILVT